MSAPATPQQPMDARIRARRARVRADAARRRQRRTISLFVLLLVVAGVAVALRSPLFEITGIEVRGVGERRAEIVRRAARITPAEHLLTAPLAEAEARVERLAWVADADVRRVPPSTVAIDVTARTPLLTVRTDGAAWKVDDDAVLLDGGAVADAPVVRAGGVELPELGAPVADRRVREAIAVHTGLPSWLRAQVVAYEVPRPRDVRLRLRVPVTGDAGDGGEDGDTAEGADTADVRVRFGAPTDMPLKTEVIRVLLPEAIDEGGDIDVRAPANPVVVPRARQGDADG